MRKRWQSNLKEVKAELRPRMHTPVPTTGQYVALGNLRTYALLRCADGCLSVSVFRMAAARLLCRLSSAVARKPALPGLTWSAE